MAASSGTAAMVDPTKPAKYPVILSDDLLGDKSREVFTGVRYNHRPTDDAPSSARIKAGTPGSATFDLAFRDAEGSRYGYSGRRSMDRDKFVLIFDPSRKAFVLHRLDSLFHMNLVSTPTNDDADNLKDEYPHLKGHGIPTPRAADKKKSAAGKAGASSALRATNTKKKTPTAADKKKDAAVASDAGGVKATSTSKKQQQQEQKQSQAEALSLPDPAASPEPQQKKKAAPTPAPAPAAPPSPPPAARKKRRDEEEDDESDEDESDGDDGGLTIEYPGGKAPGAGTRTDFSPAFQPVPFTDFIHRNGTAEEDEDADGEADIDDDYGAEGGGAPLDAAPPSTGDQAGGDNDAEVEDEDADADFEDLEIDLQAELEKELNNHDDDSDISEED